MTAIFRRLFETHTKLIVFTFEIFWIFVFILERLGNQTAGGIPQFIYVNF